MTEFNSFNPKKEENISAEESKIPSAEGVLEQENEFYLKSEFKTQEKTADVENVEQFEGDYTNIPEGEPEFKKEAHRHSFVSRFSPCFDPVIFEEKSEIKTDARTIGASFLSMYGIIFVFNLAVVIIAMILQASTSKEAADILWEPAVMQVQQIIFASFSFTVPFILIYRLSGIRISDLISFSLPRKKTFLPFFLIGVAFCSFSNIASSIAESIFKDANINYEVTTPKNPEGFFGFMLAFISTVIVPALAEEFACRGLMLGLLKKYGEGFAIIASSLLFGLMHGNFEQMPFAFLVGLILGFITVKSGTILIAIAVHAFNNFVSIAFQYFLSSVPSSVQNIGYTIFLMISLLLGIIAIFLFHGKDTELYKLEPSKMKVTETKKLIWFFTSAPILIYVGICLLESMQFFVF